MRYTQYLSGILSEADFYEMGNDPMSNAAAPMAPQMGGHEKIQGLRTNVQTPLDKLHDALESGKTNPMVAKQLLAQILKILPLNHTQIMDVVRSHDMPVQ